MVHHVGNGSQFLGATDFIIRARTAGPTTVIALSNGAELMTRVTGVGCALSATVAAFVGSAATAKRHAAAVNEDDKDDAILKAVVTAVAATGIAGEMAAEVAPLPGSFSVAFLDRLASLSAEDFRRVKQRLIGSE